MKHLRISLVAFVVLFSISSLTGQESQLSTTEASQRFSSDISNSFLAYPEYREEPIKWFDSIPEQKILAYLNPENFKLTAHPGEYFTFQIGLWAIDSDLSNVQVEFSDLKGESKRNILATKMSCFNTGGTDFKGNAFSKVVNVQGGRVQALWMGIDLDNVERGNYTGSLTILTNGEKQIVSLSLSVAGETSVDHGYNRGKDMSRLNWLNSRVGIDEKITEGYIPVTVDNDKLSILGRSFKIASNGLPSSINTYFSASNQSILETSESIIENPFRFIIEKSNGEIVKLFPGPLEFTKKAPSKVVWKVMCSSDEFALECEGQLEFDGFVDYHLNLTAKTGVSLKDIRMEIPVTNSKSEYMMGLGHEGGTRTPDWRWKWDVAKNQDMLWVGDVNGGLRIKWKAENYVRPLINIYYAFGPLQMPTSWSNKGEGGVNISQENNNVEIVSYSGNREMKPGDQLNYDFELLITPFRRINRDDKFGDRYYHGGGTNTSVKIENAQKAGANIINIHHAEDIYPFINYPFLDANVSDLSSLVSDAHEQNMRMKFYYTTRELTKNLPEFWAFNSLNGEVIFPGPGNESRTEALHPNGPNEWLIKNVREKYIPAWYNMVKEGKFKGHTDLSVITTPDSRLNNFYIAGLDWMIRNIEIDGVYIDDSALDRFTLQRARKIIDQYRPEGRMDLHSWNHYNKWAGYTNCLNLYMDLLPYFDLVWIGEGRDYNRDPDHWLIEVSGIPFGLTGQMLQGGGNPWRGMVYGITARAGWTEGLTKEIWDFWDDYRIEQMTMLGYWENDPAVSCSNPKIKATVYKGTDETIIAIANWTDQPSTTAITIDWEKLGLNPKEIEAYIPEIPNYQEQLGAISTKSITITGGKGYLIVLQKKSTGQE